MECISEKMKNITKSDEQNNNSSQNSITSSNICDVDKKTTNTLVIVTPCAACKFLRRRCTADNCLLAPYFPPAEPLKFIITHRVFGASNIIKLLQDLQEYQRADAVSSLVYEAEARMRDPIYGSAGTICHLQKHITDLQAELAKVRAELLNLQCQHTSLTTTLIYMEQNSINHTSQQPSISQLSFDTQNFLVDDTTSDDDALFESFLSINNLLTS